MFLNVEQLEKQLDKEDFQENGSMAAFNAIPEFHDIRIQHLESVKKSIDERAQHKRKYDNWVNERQMQTIEEKVDMSKALDVSLVDTKSRKPMLQSNRNQSVVRKSTAFNSKRSRILKPRCDSQVDVNNDLSKPVTTHYFPKARKAASAKPHHMIASSNCRNSSKNMPRFSSNDMVHNHYLEEAKKKTQEGNRNSEPSLMLSARSQSTANEVNSCAKVSFNKTTNKNKPVKQISVPNTHEREISTGHRFSNQKTYVVQKKTMTLRSCLRWKPTGRIFKTVGLRWVPTRKIFASSTTKVDSEPQNGFADITNQYECEQTLDVSVDRYLINQGFKKFSTDVQAMTSDHNSSELRIHDHNNELSSSKLVQKVVPSADKIDTLR
nr:hypothetical protein [Tanacetum cinerariifolium]